MLRQGGIVPNESMQIVVHFYMSLCQEMVYNFARNWSITLPGKGGGDVAQLVKRRTGTPLRQVRLLGAAKDFSPRVNFQCRLFYGTRTPPCKETQTVVVWSCLPLIRFGQNQFSRHSERGEEDEADRGRGGKTTSGNGRPGVRRVPEGSGEQGKMEETSCKIICGAPTTLVVKG